MKKSRFSEVQLIGILCQQGQGQTRAYICREHSSNEPTFYQEKGKRDGLKVKKLQYLKPWKKKTAAASNWCACSRSWSNATAHPSVCTVRLGAPAQRLTVK